MKFTKRKRQPAFHSLLHFCTPSKNSCDFDFAQFPTTECQFQALSKRSRIFLKKGDFFLRFQKIRVHRSVLESFWPIDMKTLKRWKYDSISYRACVMLIVLFCSCI